MRLVEHFPLIGLRVFIGEQGAGWKIPVVLNVAPTLQLKYKETFEKQKGHYLAGKEISEFPGVVHCLDFQKMRSAVSKAHFEFVSDLPFGLRLVGWSSGNESILRLSPIPCAC